MSGGTSPPCFGRLCNYGATGYVGIASNPYPLLMKHLVLLATLCTLVALGGTPPGRYIVEFSDEPAAVSASAVPEGRQARANARVGELKRQHASMSRAIQQRGAEVTGETTIVA